MEWREEAIARDHDRGAFDCGVPELGLALAIDAKDESAARWYARFGALPLLDCPLKLVLPLSVIAKAISASTSVALVEGPNSPW